MGSDPSRDAGIAYIPYVAVFDEIVGGTAIFKKFVGNDGMPSDHYLFLTGKAAKMLRKEISPD